MTSKMSEYCWKVQWYLMKRYGCDAADRMMDPLTWYIGTGRASLDFLRALLEAKPYMIGRQLAKEGSVDDAIQRIKAYIGVQ